MRLFDGDAGGGGLVEVTFCFIIYSKLNMDENEGKQKRVNFYGYSGTNFTSFSLCKHPYKIYIVR